MRPYLDNDYIRNVEYKVDEEMEEMGKQMIKHCGGLPLAIKVLGGLLAAQDTLREWKMIYVNIKSHIVGRTSSSDKNISSVHHVLSLSFEELPIYLKHYFLYLAHFLEDYQISVQSLSYYWAAEGISRQRCSDGTTIREVADGYIAELVKRSMVISERDIGTSRYETCHLHDMMREVCLLKAEEENFLHIVQGTSTANSESPCRSRSRRLDVHQPNKTFHMEEKMKNTKLRNLLVIEEYLNEFWLASGLCFTRLQLMRVLDLSRAKFEGGKLPSSIGMLIHLRYLNLYQAHISYLPSFMRNLKRLIYLNIYVAGGSKIDMSNFLKETRELTYLSLPLRIHDKVKMELGNLIKLETLENFSTEHGRVRDLKGMKQLRALSISLNGGCTVEILSSYLSDMRHLENLTIKYFKVYAPTNDEEGVVWDCINLKQLKLTTYIPRLPDEQHFPSHLTAISLRYCGLEEDPMPILEKLLQLKEVELWSESFSGKRMVCSGGGFPQLLKLYFHRLVIWEEWIVEEGSMPLLHTLSIRYCQNLKELPHGLIFITSLKDLSMGEEWEERLWEGGEDYYKVQHIPSVKFPW